MDFPIPNCGIFSIDQGPEPVVCLAGSTQQSEEPHPFDMILPKPQNLATDRPFVVPTAGIPIAYGSHHLPGKNAATKQGVENSQSYPLNTGIPTPRNRGSPQVIILTQYGTTMLPAQYGPHVSSQAAAARQIGMHYQSRPTNMGVCQYGNLSGPPYFSPARYGPT